MRLAAQMRGGYYPAHPQAVAHAATFLRPPQGQTLAILDPCAGTGAAIQQLATLLGCPPALTYAIELDESRADLLRAALPEGRVLAPANFLGCRASPNRLSLVWLNAPFDDGYGGRRVEAQFLVRATDWLMLGGIMALVCPEDVADEYSDVRRHFATYYENCRIVPFPQVCRPFNEVIVFGQKRARPQVDPDGSNCEDWESAQAPHGFIYPLPPGPGPQVFEKVEPTEPELRRMLAQSPLRTHWTVAPDARLPSPPLTLGVGHVALLLASGHLDGVVPPPGQPPHVVRGTARKREHVSDITVTENPDGSTTTKTTISEKIELVVRTVDLMGSLHTFLETDAQDE